MNCVNIRMHGATIKILELVTRWGRGKSFALARNQNTVCCLTSSKVTTPTTLSEGEKRAEGRGESLSVS